MRVYYIFQIKNYFSTFYKDRPYMLYKTLEDIYYSNNQDVVLNYKFFDQLAIPFYKENINCMLNKNHIGEINYYQNINKHFINNHCNNETTTLSVYNSHLKIKTNMDYPIFFDDLFFMDRLFVCDFQNKDYFWLTKIFRKTLV